jgi:hypothetical protein
LELGVHRRIIMDKFIQDGVPVDHGNNMEARRDTIHPLRHTRQTVWMLYRSTMASRAPVLDGAEQQLGALLQRLVEHGGEGDGEVH